MTVLQFGEMVARAVGKDIQPQTPGQYRFGDTRHVFSDTAALRALGWTTTRAPQAVVDEYVAWAANQPDLRDTYENAEREMLRTGTFGWRRAPGRGSAAADPQKVRDCLPLPSQRSRSVARL